MEEKRHKLPTDVSSMGHKNTPTVDELIKHISKLEQKVNDLEYQVRNLEFDMRALQR